MTIANDQLHKDAEYCREYRAWMLNLTPKERAQLEAQGLGKPDVDRRTHKQTRDPLHCDAIIDEVEERDEYSAALAESLARFLQWQICPTGEAQNHKLSAKTVGLRAIAAISVLKPDVLGGASLNEVAARLGVSAMILTRYGRMFTDSFGIACRGQQTAAMRERKSASQRLRRLKEGSQDVDPSRN